MEECILTNIECVLARSPVIDCGRASITLCQNIYSFIFIIAHPKLTYAPSNNTSADT